MNDNFNPEDPFGWGEPEPQPEKLNWFQKVKCTILTAVIMFMFSGIAEAVEKKKERRKKYREVIKQGWFGEYSEWHER